MKGKYSEDQIQGVLLALDKAIKEGPWEESNFLRILGNKLRELRNTFAEQQGLNRDLNAEQELNQAALNKKRSGMKEVFVALYTSEGRHVASWERILANLPRQVVSRPVYEREEDVQAAIKAKENKVNEAYVGIFIPETAILQLPVEKIPKDRLGKSLISLKDRAIDLGQVSRFVHMAIEYEYVKGRLVTR